MCDQQFMTYEARCAAAVKLAAEVLPHNKEVLFNALAAAGTDTVTIGFDGFGDSGQFDTPLAVDAENREVALPTHDIVVKSVNFETGTVTEQTTTPGDYIENLACAFLEQTYCGWENGCGAQGEFRFSLSGRTITLDYNERYTEYQYYEHEF